MRGLVVALLLAAARVSGDEDPDHQRVAAADPQGPAWSGHLGLTLSPSGTADWDLGMGGGLTVRLPLALTLGLDAAATGRVRSRLPVFGLTAAWPALSLAWTDGDTPRHSLRAAWHPDADLDLDAEVAAAADPLLLSGSLWVRLPASAWRRPLWTGGVRVSLRELLNDQWLTSLSLGPELVVDPTVPARPPALVVAVTWGLLWVGGPLSLENQVTWGSHGAWVWAGEGGLTW